MKKFSLILIVNISLFTIQVQAQEHTFCHTVATSSNADFAPAMRAPSLITKDNNSTDYYCLRIFFMLLDVAMEQADKQ
jgi:hypothetical protein